MWTSSCRLDMECKHPCILVVTFLTNQNFSLQFTQSFYRVKYSTMITELLIKEYEQVGTSYSLHLFFFPATLNFHLFVAMFCLLIKYTAIQLHFQVTVLLECALAMCDCFIRVQYLDL